MLLAFRDKSRNGRREMRPLQDFDRPTHRFARIS
jgi:hypothetical protein